MVLPAYITPSELAEHLGWAERALRAELRRQGTYRQLGKKMVLLENDVAAFLEGIKPCPSSSTSEAMSGTSGAPLPVNAYDKARAQLTGKSPKGSRRKSKTLPGEVVSMDRRRK